MEKVGIRELRQYASRYIAEGTVVVAQDDLSEWLRNNPPPSPLSGASISESLQEQRKERL